LRIALSVLAIAFAAAPANAQTPICATAKVSVSVDFPSGGRHACRIVDGEIVLAVEPEGRPINPSPWYAFRLDASRRTQARVVLDYGADEHRYAPQTTRDGRTWRALAARDVNVSSDEHRATLRLSLREGATFVAAQPIVTPDAMHGWARALAQPAGFEEVEYGRSIDGRPLIAFRGGSGSDLVVAITRQHPPETTGAAAFRAFTERMLSSDAAAFRAGHRILLVPMANPDGVMRGHWRWNNGGLDLNRDWRDFAQPETRALRDLILAEANGRRAIAFFDFHSTDRTVIYSPPLDANSPSIDFLPLLRRRLDAALDRTLSWSFSHNPNGNTAKRWSLEALRAPGLTVELDDNASASVARCVGAATADAVIAYVGGER
jgi:hypothetical protein